MSSRRELLAGLAAGAGVGLLPAATPVATPAARAARGGQPTMRERVRTVFESWDSLGIHRTGTRADAVTARWMADRARAMGHAPELDGFPFERRVVERAELELDAQRIEGLPLFDGGATGAAGIEAPLGEAGSEGALGVLRVPPYASMPGAVALETARRSDAHPGLIAVTDDRYVLPGLAVLNAEHWGAPFGPPVLQVASTHHERLARAASEGRRARLAAPMRREPATACNVSVRVPGRDDTLAPVVVMTPRSGWWTSTAERGGGLAVWFELLHLLAEVPPERPVRFTANTGHELGHVGLARYMDAHRDLIAGARAWLHLGANFGASLHPEVHLQCSDETLAGIATGAFDRHDTAPDVTRPVGERPVGEARDVHDGGGRYVSLVGRNGAFHHPDDRWPDMVDLDRTVRIARAFREILLELARA